MCGSYMPQAIEMSPIPGDLNKLKTSELLSLCDENGILPGH